MRRPRIQWQLLDGVDAIVMWTPGWLPDTPTLRWSLANDLRLEGVRDGWRESYEFSDAATITEGHVAEDEFGDVVRVDRDGTPFGGGDPLSDVKTATFAQLSTD